MAMHVHVATPALHPPAGSILVVPGDTWEDTLLAAEPGSVIAFAPGTYASTCNIQLRKNISLVGVEGRGISNGNRLPQSEPIGHFHATVAALVRIKGLSLVNGSRTDDAGSNFEGVYPRGWRVAVSSGQFELR